MIIFILSPSHLKCVYEIIRENFYCFNHQTLHMTSITFINLICVLEILEVFKLFDYRMWFEVSSIKIFDWFLLSMKSNKAWLFWTQLNEHHFCGFQYITVTMMIRLNVCMKCIFGLQYRKSIQESQVKMSKHLNCTEYRIGNYILFANDLRKKEICWRCNKF